MKKIYKILLIIIITILFVAINIRVVQAGGVVSSMQKVENGSTVSAGNQFVKIIRRVIGFLRLLTGLLSVVVIAYTGFQLVVETPEGRSKVKEKMVPIVIGVILTFMASTIAGFIVGIFEGNATASSDENAPTSSEGKLYDL